VTKEEAVNMFSKIRIGGTVNIKYTKPFMRKASIVDVSGAGYILNSDKLLKIYKEDRTIHIYLISGLGVFVIFLVFIIKKVNL